jgi:hypothetical protein
MSTKERCVARKPTETLLPAEGTQGDALPTREQLVAAMSQEAASLVRTDAFFRDLQSLKKAIPVLCDYLTRERRRKKPSKQLQWFLAEVFRPGSPVSIESIASSLDLLRLLRMQMEGAVLPPDSGEAALRCLKNLMATRNEPKYWREYRAWRDGKPVSEILRELHPGYDQLHSWEREKYFRKVYNAIQRLVEKYGGPSLSVPPPQRP